MGDEELTATGVGKVERHPDSSTQVWTLVELVADRVARPALAVTSRITALNHEVGDHAMERQAVEEMFLRQRHEVFDRQGCIEHRQLDLDRSLVGVDIRLRGEGRIDERLR